jgi:hypothetical protein
MTGALISISSAALCGILRDLCGLILCFGTNRREELEVFAENAKRVREKSG